MRAPPTVSLIFYCILYYFLYARVSCRVCIVPKCAKAMEYLSSWAKSRKEKLLAFSTLCSVGYVIPRARASPGSVNYEGLLHCQLLKPSYTVPAAMGSITVLQCAGKEALQGDLGILALFYKRCTCKKRQISGSLLSFHAEP